MTLHLSLPPNDAPRLPPDVPAGLSTEDEAEACVEGARASLGDILVFVASVVVVVALAALGLAWLLGLW